MNSELNPEAPEFYPHVTSFTQGAYKALSKTVRTCNTFPSGRSYAFFKTFTEFNIVTCQLSEKVINQTNQLLNTEVPKMKLQKKHVPYNTEMIVDTNDRILDKIEINIDRLNNVNTSDALLSGPVISKIQVGSTLFIGATNIAPPQLNFKDHIDNSENLWVPKISDKPNNIKPLALEIIYNENGEAVGYEHPYKVELNLYEPPHVYLKMDTEPPPFPPPMNQTKYTYIDTEEKVNQLVEHLHTVRELAVDVEHHSYRTYQGFTCLIQISTDEGGDFIIDALAVRQHLHKLNLSFTDPRKIKVFHGADMDVLWLQRDFGVYIVGLFDTFQAARALKLNGCALKNVLLKYCDVTADKKFQLADWRIRPLTDEMVEYARKDTHYLLYVWRRMRAELLAATGGVELLQTVFRKSVSTCLATYNKMAMNETNQMQLYVRSKKMFNARQLAAYKMLFKWRDQHGRILDESVSYLLPNHMLLALAETLPREMQGVHAICRPMPPFVKQNLITLHRMLLSCRELPLEPVAGTQEITTSGPVSYQRKTLFPLYDVHDLSQFPNLAENEIIDFDKQREYLNEVINEVSVPTMLRDETNNVDNSQFVSNLHVHMQIPPYYRYRGYRYLAMDKEIKMIANKEAKVTAIAQGDPLIQAEVLLKLQQTKTTMMKEESNVDKLTFAPEDEQSSKGNAAQRKRKMPVENERKAAPNAQATPKPSTSTAGQTKTTEYKNKLNAKADNHNFRPFNYKHANYKKFHHNECDQPSKEPKMRFKKH